MRRVLVTGASGFIGRWSVPDLIKLDFDVHAVVSGVHREVPEQLSGAIVHQADLLDLASIDAVIAAVTPSHLLHFAWIAQPGVYWHSADNFRWLAASEHLMRSFHAAGGERIVMAGSCAEYAWSGSGHFDEYASPLADDTAASTPAYAVCKLRLQRVLTDFSAQRRLSSAWGRIFFQYGPFEHPERLVPAVIRSLLCNQEALCSHGRQVRSFLHSADVGSAFAALVNARVEGPVNIGSDQPVALADLIDQIARKIGRPELVRLGARAAGAEPAFLVPVMRRLRDETQWRPRFGLDEGLSDVIDWWRGQLAQAPS